MNNKIEDLKEILKNIDIKNFNLEIIEKNIQLLISVFKKFKLIDSENFLDQKLKNVSWTTIDKNNSKHKTLSNYLNNYVSMVDSDVLTKKVSKSEIQVFFEFENIIFFYVCENESQLEKDLELIYRMIKITIILNKYVYPSDSTIRHVVWIPIDRCRDFEYDTINKSNLTKSNDEYKAFTVSGVTSGSNPRLTLITRYEEVTKLLLHELVHNFYLDGSNYHSELKSVIEQFTKLKSNNSKKRKISNYNYEFSMYESYTELLGTYLYLLFENLNVKESELVNKLIGQIGCEILYSYNTIANLAHLNGYKSYDEFIQSKVFLGNICIFEYYFVKGLMYNNFELVLPKNSDEFINMYSEINTLINNADNDKLLKQIYNIVKPQSNYKYIIN